MLAVAVVVHDTCLLKHITRTFCLHGMEENIDFHGYCYKFVPVA